MAPVAGAGLAPHSWRLSVVLPCTLKCIILCQRLRKFNLQAPSGCRFEITQPPMRESPSPLKYVHELSFLMFCLAVGISLSPDPQLDAQSGEQLFEAAVCSPSPPAHRL